MAFAESLAMGNSEPPDRAQADTVADMGQRKPNADWIRLGERLRAHRTTAGLTRQALATGLSLTPERIGAFERGEAAISAVELQALARRLETPITAFLGALAGLSAAGRSDPTLFEQMAATDDGAALAQAFVRLKTPRLRNHLVGLAQALVEQESGSAVRDQV